MLAICALMVTTLAACDDLPSAPEQVELVSIASLNPSFAKGGAGGGGAGGTLTSISPSGTEINVGETVDLVGVDQNGNVIEVSWSTSNAAVAAVESNGRAKGVGKGSAVITAKSKNVRISADIVVREAEGTVQSSETTQSEGTSTTSEPAPLPPSLPQACTDLPHTRVVGVSTVSQLGSAVTNAQPGDLIHIADGSYTGRWTVSRSGTASARITLCGSRKAILQGTGYDSPAPLRVVGASYVTLHGFTVQHGLWGIQLERSSYNRLSGLLVHDIGQEAVSIRDFSTYNVVEGNEIRYTGRRTGYAQYGEGVYLGTWSGRWPDLNTPDRSDYNQILNNKFGPHIPGDHMDAKEGTSFTVIRGNTFDATGFGAGMAADQGVDAPFVLQSNDAIVENNTIIGEAGNPRLVHGIRVWTGQGGWGRRSTFLGNTMDLKGASGYGVHVHSGAEPTAVVKCAPSNSVTHASSGLTNITCTK